MSFSRGRPHESLSGGGFCFGCGRLGRTQMIEMHSDEQWGVLHRCADRTAAGRIATSIAAMEFEVRMRDAATGAIVEPGAPDGGGPYLIEVHSANRADLADVLEQVIEEQESFDAALEARNHRTARRDRWLVPVLLIVVIGLLLALNDLINLW